MVTSLFGGWHSLDVPLNETSQPWNNASIACMDHKSVQGRDYFFLVELEKRQMFYLNKLQCTVHYLSVICCCICFGMCSNDHARVTIAHYCYVIMEKEQEEDQDKVITAWTRSLVHLVSIST